MVPVLKCMVSINGENEEREGGRRGGRRRSASSDNGDLMHGEGEVGT